MNCPFSLPPTACPTERQFVQQPCNLPQYDPYPAPTHQLPTPCDSAQDITVSHSDVCGDMWVRCNLTVAGTLSSFSTTHVDVLQSCTIECSSTLTISAASLVFVSPTLSVGGPILASTVISPSTIVFNTPTVSTGTLNTHTLLTGTFTGITTLTTCTIACPTTLFLQAPHVQALNNVTVATTLAACQISCPSSTFTITAPTTSMTGTLAATTLVSCTISCSAAHVTMQAPLVQAPGDLTVTGTLSACQLVCSAFVLDAPTVALVGTLNVPTLNTCTIPCSSTLTLQAPTVQVPGALTFPSTLVACQIACPSSTLMLDSPTVVMTGTVQAATLASCAVTCPSTFTVLAPFVRATDDMVVPGTVSVCGMACNAATLTLDASITNMTGAVQATTLAACVITCTSTPLTVLAPSAQAQHDMVVGGTLTACQLECDATTLTIMAPTIHIPGMLVATTLTSCTITCSSTLALQAPLVQVPLAFAATLNTCQLECTDTLTIMAPTVVMTGTIQIQTLDICTVSCATTLAIVTPTLQAVGDLLVPSTLTACQIACPSSTLTVNAPVVMTSTIQAVTLDTCLITCPGTLNLLASTVQLSGDLVVSSLAACTIASPCGVLELGALAGVNATSQLQVDGTICVSTVFVCGSQSSLYVSGTLTVDQVQLTTNLLACTITCPGGTLQLPASGVSLAGPVRANGTVNTCRIKVATLSPCNSTVTVAGNLSFPNSIVNGVNVGGGPGLVFSTITTVDNFNMRRLITTLPTVGATIITSGNVVDMRLAPPLAVLPRTIRDVGHNGAIQSVAPNTWITVAFSGATFSNGYFGFPMTQPGTYFFSSGFRVNLVLGTGVTRVTIRYISNSAGQASNQIFFMTTIYLQNPNPYTNSAALLTRGFKQLPKIAWPNAIVQLMFNGTTNTQVRNNFAGSQTGDGWTFGNPNWRSTTALG